MKICFYVFVINLVFIASTIAQSKITKGIAQEIAQEVAQEMQAITQKHAQKLAEISRVYKKRSQQSTTSVERQDALNEYQKTLQQLNLLFQQKIAKFKQQVIEKYKKRLIQNHN
ncbi:MAG: hypothetical protein COB26_10260 [Piscirickettsiaceae bacterium]|nr:MAG: hypothetical protein COB26_10260 [Piscirickettsiaceae bacterium]